MSGEDRSSLIGAFVTVAVMASILLRRRRQRTDVLFAVLCVVLVLWFLAAFLRSTFGSEPWLRVEIGIAAVIPATMIKLFSDLVPGSGTRIQRFEGAAYPLSVLVAVVVISPLGNLAPVQIGAGAYVAILILLASRFMLHPTELAAGTVEFARRRYLAIGASVVAILALLGEIPALGSTMAAVGHLAVMVYVFFLSQVILRDRLLDLNEFLGRMLMLAILALLFASITALLVGLGTNASSRLFNAIVGVIILITLYEPLKDRLEAKMAELFFRERHRFERTLEDLRRRMQHGVIDPARMADIVVESLYDTRRATHVAVYLLEPLGDAFMLHGHRGPQPAARVSAVDLPALWQAIQQNRTPILAERIGGSTTRTDDETSNRDLLDALRAVSADVLLPFVSGDLVLGFLAIRDDRSIEPYSTAEIAQLMTIAETATTVVWNSRLTDKLRERERLAAIGSMAAGLAHEIRNPLGAIKGAAEYLDPESFEHHEASEFLQVIVDETNRLNTVVSQFLNYARPFRPNFQPTELNDVVRKTVKLLEAQRSERPIPIELELDENIPVVEADSEQVKQVILNLVLNGVDASRDSQRPVTIATRYNANQKIVELRVRDRGPGIPREDIDKIFLPFFTTKDHGTGLGLAVCQRIVTNHGGAIYPEARHGGGTDFVVRLPIHRRDVGSTTGSNTRTAGRAPSILP